MNRTVRATVRILIGCVPATLLLLSACSVNVKKEPTGEDKQVDIRTPIGGIHVSNEVSPEDIGLPVYPGARVKQKDTSGDDKSANVNVSGFGYGVKVAAQDYESKDSADKVIAFYKDQLKGFGNVVVCHTHGLDVDANIRKANEASHELTCGGSSGSTIELKVGTKEKQHIVAVESEGSGSSFSLVYVRTHGKSADI